MNSKPKGHSVSSALLARARDFRHPLTPPEAKVWEAVRDRRIGFKIRRQHPIGRFIADFYCAEARLVIEIDGDTHAAPDQAAYDVARTEWLEERGYQVIRFDAAEVGRNMAAVVKAIRAACAKRERSWKDAAGS
jgi:very-short-patch-repair endonuclease